MITLQDYLRGNEKRYPADYTPQIKAAAEDTISRLNRLLGFFGEERPLTSGWRPAGLNAKTQGASKTSWHIQAKAADFADGDGAMDDWLMSAEGEAALVECGLWHEHPSSTKSVNGGDGWCHVQTVAPRSGNRHFYK